MTDATLTTQVVGYQVRAAGDGDVVGEVEGIRPRGMRLYRLRGHRGRRGYVPREAVLRVSHGTNTIFLVEGIDADRVAGAPPPPREGPDPALTALAAREPVLARNVSGALSERVAMLRATAAVLAEMRVEDRGCSRGCCSLPRSSGGPRRMAPCSTWG